MSFRAQSRNLCGSQKSGIKTQERKDHRKQTWLLAAGSKPKMLDKMSFRNEVRNLSGVRSFVLRVSC